MADWFGDEEKVEEMTADPMPTEVGADVALVCALCGKSSKERALSLGLEKKHTAVWLGKLDLVFFSTTAEPLQE